MAIVFDVHIQSANQPQQDYIQSGSRGRPVTSVASQGPCRCGGSVSTGTGSSLPPSIILPVLLGHVLMKYVEFRG